MIPLPQKRSATAVINGGPLPVGSAFRCPSLLEDPSRVLIARYQGYTRSALLLHPGSRQNRSRTCCRWYIGACDRASLPHLAAGALDQHRRTRDGRDVALGGHLEVGLPAYLALADAAVQPPDLRRKRRLRSGDRRQKPPQGHPRRGAHKSRGDTPHLARRPLHEFAAPDLLRPLPPVFGSILDAPLRAALRRLLGPARALQGPPLS